MALLHPPDATIHRALLFPTSDSSITGHIGQSDLNSPLADRILFDFVRMCCFCFLSKIIYSMGYSVFK